MKMPTLTFIHDRKGVASRKNPAVVELRITFGGKRKYLSTGIKLRPKEWNGGEISACHSEYKELNEMLRTMKQKVTEIITRMIQENRLDIDAIGKILKEEVTQCETFLDYARQVYALREPKIAEGTKKHYKVTFDFLEEWGKIVDFHDVTEQNITAMDNELRKKGLKECSRYTYHKHMKLFITQAINDGYLERNPYNKLDIRKGNESGLTRFLTPAEFHRFEACEIDDKHLERVRDLFVFQTWTMMSYSDLCEFSIHKCVKVDGQTVYRGKRQKTGIDFTIVLTKPALRILKKYKNKLPIISNVNYNAYLKLAVRYARIKKPVTTHWARHTGATMLLNEKNVPLHVIQHILGHASIRETEKTYAKLMDETILKYMA